VIALVGATATGKTDLGEAIAARLDAEVVCADSRQVFAELEAGTGKPDPAVRATRPHHLFDALHLGERASAGGYARAALGVLAGIRARRRPALLVGGSGLYIRSVAAGLSPAPPSDPVARARLETECEGEGTESLHARLARVDPPTAARLAPRDRQRILRALEVFETSGRPLSWWHGRPGTPAPGEWTVLELVVPTAPLRERIARRARAMLAGGLIEETQALLAAGHGPALGDLRAIGYDEAIEVLAGRCDVAEAERRIVLRTVQLAKRQRTWFRHQVDAVRLDGALDASSLLERALAAARDEDGHARRQPRALR
jgi:tRNA dimethylallyltransferase